MRKTVSIWSEVSRLVGDLWMPESSWPPSAQNGRALYDPRMEIGDT
jgi:hypothetical protein